MDLISKKKKKNHSLIRQDNVVYWLGDVRLRNCIKL